MLRLHGRMDDVINVGGYKVNPAEVEEAVQAFEGIRDCICIPAPHILLGTAPKLLYVPKQGKTIKPKDIADFLKGRIENYKIPPALSGRRCRQAHLQRQARLQSI